MPPEHDPLVEMAKCLNLVSNLLIVLIIGHFVSAKRGEIHWVVSRLLHWGHNRGAPAGEQYDREAHMTPSLLSDADRLVFFDLETTGREPGKHRIIQFAGIAVDARTLAAVEELNVRVQLLRTDAWEAEALAGNCFSQRTGYTIFNEAVAQDDDGALRFAKFEACAEKWNAEAKPHATALALVDAFLNRHKSVPMKSRRTGAEYRVARLAGHNVHAFDIPHLRAWYGSRFFPAEYRCLDTFHLACWVAWMESGCANVPLNLPALRERYGIRVEGAAHDALVDVRATVELARRLLFELTQFRMPEVMT